VPPAATRQEPPADLERWDLSLDGEPYVVLSFPSRPHPPHPDLSPAESAVALAAASGLSNAEIAAERGCSLFTVRNQLASACRKLGVSSRAQLCLCLAHLHSRGLTAN
jgi:DNA-binding CsgD family transcriptional regulator